jgi:hypothetical protein
LGNANPPPSAIPERWQQYAKTMINTRKFISHYFVFLLTFIGTSAVGQERSSPKLVKSEGNFTYNATGTIFPEQIDSYPRKSIYSFTKQDNDIEVTYESPDETSFAIKIYPAGDGTEGRLRKEYLKTLQTISNAANKTIGFDQGPIRRVGTKYICNGFQAVSKLKTKDEVALLALYECGAWFLRIKITSKDLDSNRIQALEEKILNKYDPTKFTELKPLNLKSDFIVAPALGKDKVRAKYVLKSGLKKLEWANKNVPENERASGFPDLYLNMHIDAFKEFAECKDENYTSDNDIAKLISDINKVIKANYLPEFLMKQYGMVMIVPDDIKFDFEGFTRWQEQYKITMDVHKFYYLIVYRQPK